MLPPPLPTRLHLCPHTGPSVPTNELSLRLTPVFPFGHLLPVPLLLTSIPTAILFLDRRFPFLPAYKHAGIVFVLHPLSLDLTFL